MTEESKTKLRSKELPDMESRYIWWGASRLSFWLIDLLGADLLGEGNRIMKKPETIINIFRFLSQNKADMLNLLYNAGGVSLRLAPVKDKKGKLRSYMPTSIIWKGYSKKRIKECEFISPQEYKFRDTSRILADALNRACETIVVLTGQDKNEVFNRLLEGDSPSIPESFADPPAHEHTKNTFFVITEKDWDTMQQEKKEEEARKSEEFAKLSLKERLKQLDVGFRVLKLDDVENVSEYTAGG